MLQLTVIKNILNSIVSNKTLLLLIYGIVTSGLIYWGYNKYQSLKDEADRYKNNQEALLTDIETYKTENGKNAAKVTELELSNGEFQKLCSEQAEALKEMGINTKRLESVSSTVTETKVNGTTVLRDTIVYNTTNEKIVEKIINGETVHDTILELVPDTVKYFSWSDPWNKIDGKIDGDKVDCSYSGKDTLTIAATKIPKKFLFFKWGCKRIEVDLVNQNPSNQVIYNRTVKFK